MISKANEILNMKVITFADTAVTLGEILIIPLWLIAAYWMTKLIIGGVRRHLRKKDKDPNVIHLITRIINVIAIIVIFLTTLSLLSIPITAFAFLSGAIAIGFGFGAQNIINNFISGWILMGEKPIRIGDFLEVDGAKGTIEEIGTRSTRIRRVDGVHMLVPNSSFIENTVINWTLRDHLIRGTVTIGVAYGSPAKKVAEIIMQATKEQDAVLTDPAPDVVFQDFGDNALIFDVFFWVDSTVKGGIRGVSSNIRFRLDELMAENGIEIPFPQRDVHIDGSIKIEKEQ